MALKSGAEVLIERREGSGEQLRLGNDDEIKTSRRLVSPENLSNQSFSSVALDRAAEPPRSADAEPGLAGFVRQRNEGQETPLGSDASLLDAKIVGPPADALWWPETLGHRPAGL